MSIRRDAVRRKPRWWDLGCESLDALSPRTLQELCRRGDQHRVWPGQTLLTQGSVVHWVYVVLDGELVLRRAGRDVRVLNPGCVFGCLETLDHTHAPADLVARDVARVLALPVAAYTALVQTHPDFAFWVLRALARQNAAAA